MKSGEYSLKLSDQSYNKHLQGHRDYERYAQSRLEKGQTPPSFLVIPKEEAQKIIQTRSGTGIIKTRRDGTALNQEMITCDRIIGKYYSKGEWHDTNKAIIHHGRKGSHIVPHRGVIMINVWDYDGCNRLRIECVDGQVIEGELTSIDDEEESGLNEEGLSIYTKDGLYFGIGKSEIKHIAVLD